MRRKMERLDPLLYEEWLAWMEYEPIGIPASDEQLAWLLLWLVQVQTGGKPRIPGKPDLSRTSWTMADVALRRGPQEQIGRSSAPPPKPPGPSMADIRAAFSQIGAVGRPG